MSIIRRLKSRYSYTYRLRNGWGIQVIRNEREMKALIEFCDEEFKEYQRAGFTDSQHALIWRETVKLYKKWKKNGTGYAELEDYIENHVGCYWS